MDNFVRDDSVRDDSVRDDSVYDDPVYVDSIAITPSVMTPFRIDEWRTYAENTNPNLFANLDSKIGTSIWVNCGQISNEGFWLCIYFKCVFNIFQITPRHLVVLLRTAGLFWSKMSFFLTQDPMNFTDKTDAIVLLQSPNIAIGSLQSSSNWTRIMKIRRFCNPKLWLLCIL